MKPAKGHAWDILIVDDEQPARAELMRMLRAIDPEAALREAGSASEALKEIKMAMPDLLLLDIQMPGGSGFDLLSRLGKELPPLIFTTAHEQFAVKSYSVEALDYLLKPFDEKRLSKALARLPTPTPSTPPKLSEGDFLKLKLDGVTRMISVEDIEFFQTTGNVTDVFVHNRTVKLYKPLRYFSKRLDPAIFFMAARDQLINLRKINNFTVEETGCVNAQLQCRRTVLFSRRQSRIFKNSFVLKGIPRTGNHPRLSRSGTIPERARGSDCSGR
jgi:two-component system LytT family response regulator